MSNQSRKSKRITILIPRGLKAQASRKGVLLHFASTTEYIRHAIREQLKREKSPIERMAEEDPRILESIRQADRAETGEFNIARLRDAISGNETLGPA